MPEPPRRKRFQIHLSTAIVMMFVAGGLIWINTIEHTGTVFGGEEAYEFDSIEFEYRGYGWPIESAGRLTGNAKYPNGRAYVHSPGSDIHRKFISVFNIGLDALVGVIILFAICFLCEWLIRRRAARKDV